MPLAIDQRVGALVWSSLAQGRLTGKVRRDQPAPQDSRVRVTSETSQSGSDETLYGIVDTMDAIAAANRQNPLADSAQLAAAASNSVFARLWERATKPSYARISEALDWQLTAEQVAALDTASAVTPIYPYWHQRNFTERNPFPTR